MTMNEIEHNEIEHNDPSPGWHKKKATKKKKKKKLCHQLKPERSA